MTDIGSNKSLCFFWHEGIGNRGVNEIATCVLRYLEELSNNIPGANVVFYSDNCWGQQKNRLEVQRKGEIKFIDFCLISVSDT